MSILKRNILFFLLIIFIFVVFVFQGIVYLDPDFGWHLKFGEIIFNTRLIPSFDLFSYTMPSYHFVNHEWLSDYLVYCLYIFIGKLGLSIIFALIAIVAVLMQAINISSKWKAVPLMLIFSNLIIFQGVRFQIISLFFASLLLIILFNAKKYQTFKYLIPIIFLIWANLHGGFPVGLIILFIFYIGESIKRKRLILEEAVIFLTSVFITLINPYGIYLWGEIKTTLLDTSLRWSISEWVPSIFSLNLPYAILIALSVYIFIKFFGKYSLAEKLLFIVLLLFGITSIRNIPFFLLVAFIITGKGIETFYKSLKNIPLAQGRFLRAYRVMVVFCLMLFFYAAITSSSLKMSEGAYYPKNAVKYLNKHVSSGQVFSVYNWGGYLIWKLPQKKVFVDGRMPSWKKIMIPVGESKNAFLEQQQVFNGETSLLHILKKYNIDTLLLPAQKLENTSKLIKTIDNYFYSLFGMKIPNEAIFINELKQANMKIIYKDSIAIIYRKIK